MRKIATSREEQQRKGAEKEEDPVKESEGAGINQQSSHDLGLPVFPSNCKAFRDFCRSLLLFLFRNLFVTSGLVTQTAC